MSSQAEPAHPHYVMGHDDRERRRLALQGAILQPFTEGLLQRAGVTSGMRVLELGCGVGEVTLIAARLVGRHGRVTSLDIDPAAIETARARIEGQGLANVSFVHQSFDEFRHEGEFDAVIGRHILIHLPDPLRALQRVYASLRPGGAAAFQEFDFSVIHRSYPPCPLREQVLDVFRDFFQRAPTHGDVGTRLFHLFLEARFVAPDCRAEFPIDGGPDSPFYEWCAEALRSILPHAEAMGVDQGLRTGIDTLADRIREEAVTRHAAFPAPFMVGGFARKS